MKVEFVTTTHIKIPLEHEVRFSTGVLRAADHLIVRVGTSDGVVGVAEAIPRPMIYGETLASAKYVIEQTIRPAVVGQRVDRLEAMRDSTRQLAGNPGAKSAVELACFDALGKTLGISCHRLLGGFSMSVPVTMILGFGTAEQLTEQAAEAESRYGITSFKVKVGTDLRTDVRNIHELREKFPLAILCPDGNHGYTAGDARRFVEETDDCDLSWFEEPCDATEGIGRGELCRRSRVPVMGDESCATAADVLKEVTTGHSTMVSIKLARTGVRESCKIRDLCSTLGVDVVVGSQGDSTVGTYATLAFAGAGPATMRHPAELTYFLGLKGRVTASEPEISSGRMQIPEVPGFGAIIDESLLAEFEVKP